MDNALQEQNDWINEVIFRPAMGLKIKKPRTYSGAYNTYAYIFSSRNSDCYKGPYQIELTIVK
jgi:hypothetical protein